jgi:hypothetical protein
VNWWILIYFLGSNASVTITVASGSTLQVTPGEPSTFTLASDQSKLLYLPAKSNSNGLIRVNVTGNWFFEDGVKYNYSSNWPSWHAFVGDSAEHWYLITNNEGRMVSYSFFLETKGKAFLKDGNDLIVI